MKLHLRAVGVACHNNDTSEHTPP